MASPLDPGAQGKQAEAMGLPNGFKVGNCFPFGGLNVADSRLAIEDKEFSWLENYARIGKGRMRTSWDVGPVLYTAPAGKTIVSFYWFNIGAASLCAVFLSDGTAVQVASSNGAITQIGSTVGEFYQAGGQLPACCPWGSQYLLISNNLTSNSYWVWDGTLLYSSGGVSPVVTITSGGAGYTSPPVVTAFGGAGTGATYAATVVNGSVVSVVPTAPGTGYGPNDQVQLLFTGGGTDSGAVLQANVSGGTISSLLLTAGGSGYSSPPAVSFSGGGGGSGAAAYTTLTPGGLASVAVSTGGSGYTTAPNVVISGGGGTGATATATVAGGAVTGIILTNAGSGYITLPTITLTGSAGTGASATAVLIGAVVASIVLTAMGTGYTNAPTISFSGGGGTGAAAVSSLNAGYLVSVDVISGGSNFTGTPTLTFSGGGGTGAAATAVVDGGVISSVTTTAGGSGYTSAPVITVQSGINNAASATVDLMPIGLSGSCIETYQSRAWLGHPYQAGTLPAGGQISITAPESLSDFATSDGGLLFTNTDRFLRSQYTALRQSNGYLYTVGDSSTGVISNVQTSGSPTTTTFNSLNVDPQTGTSWRDTLQDYSRTILFANPFGVWGVYGGAVTKVSKNLDPLFDNAFYPPTSGALTPSAAVAEMFSQVFYLLLMTITDPFTGNPRNVMLGWDQTDWSVFSQSSAIIYIGTQILNSDPIAWGTDGTVLRPLFAAPSASLPKTLQTKLFAADSAFILEASYAIYVTVQNLAAGQTSMIFSSTTIDAVGSAQPLSLPAWMDNEIPTQGGSFQTANPIAFPLPASGFVNFGTGTDPVVAGSGLGLTMITSAPDYELVNLQLGYMDVHGLA